MKKEVDINININVQDIRRNGKTLQLSSQNGHSHVHHEKIKSNLSVSQLAFLCRLMHDTSAIVPRSQTDILKFITDNFQTSNAVEISVRSLRSKYYTVDLSTKEAIKALLNKMLIAIDGY